MTESILTSEDRAKLIDRIAEASTVLNCRSALLSRRQVALLLGYKSSALAPILSDPTFPKPILVQLSAYRRWRCGDVLDWIEARRKEFA